MQEVQVMHFNNGYNHYQNEPTIINPSIPPINVTHPTNPVSLMIQIPRIVTNFGGHPIPQSTQKGFAVQATHSTSILLLPEGDKNTYRL